MTDLAAGISGGLKASELGSGVAGFAKKMKGLAGDNAKKFLEKTGAANAVRKLDKALFDSGKLAEEERTKKRKQNAADLNNKSAMSKAGDKAINDFKKKNAKELMGMTAEQQRAKLKGVRDDAMTKEGKKLGLNDDQIKALKSDKGVKYVGSNALGYLAQAARQKMMSGGSVTKGIGDRDVNTQFSHSQAHSALKNMSEAERKQFVEAAKQGKVQIGKSKVDAAFATDKGVLRRGAALISGGLSEAAIAAGKGVGSGAGKVKRFFHDKEYDAAAKELEKEGVIDKNSVGWSRKSADKDLIRARAKENKLAKQNTKGPKVAAVAELEREAKYLSDQEAIDESGSNSAVKGAKSLGKYIERGAGRIAKVFTSDKNQKGARAGLNAGARARVNSELDNIAAERLDLQESLNDAEESLREANEELTSSPLFNEIQNLDQKVGNNTATDADKAKLKRLQREMSSDSKLAQASANAKKATVAIHQITSQMENLAAKAEPLQAFADNIDAADELRIGAIENAVIASGNEDLQAAFNSMDVDEFVKQHGDALGEDFAKLNSNYQNLSNEKEFSNFVSSNGKKY